MEKHLYVKFIAPSGLISLDMYGLQSQDKSYLIEKIHFSEKIKNGILYSYCFYTGVPFAKQLEKSESGLLYGYFDIPEKEMSTVVFTFRAIKGFPQLWAWYFFGEVLKPEQFKQKMLPTEKLNISKN